MLNSRKIKFQKLQKERVKANHSITLFTQRNGVLKVKLVSLQSCRITKSQLESAYFALIKKLKKGTSVIKILIFPDLPKTKKPNQVRMGKGKGNFAYWASFVVSGTSLFEIVGGSLKKSVEAMLSASKKLPIKTSTQIFKNN